MIFSVRALCLLVALPLFAHQDVDAPHLLTDPSLAPRISEAIDRGIENLQSEQHRDGSWTGARFNSYRTGPTAFTAYALVESGVRTDSPCIQLALDFLERNPPTMVYSAGAILLLLGEVGDESRSDLAQRSLDLLLEWESDGVRGAWSYPSGPVDLSNMAFVSLGFWAAHRLGLDVPIDVTKRLVEATMDRFQEEPFEAEQVPVPDALPTKKKSKSKGGKVAGFHYFLDRDSRPPTGSMTAAGLGILRISREIFGKKLGTKLVRQIDKSEGLGLAWLGAHWSLNKNHAHHDGDEAQVLYYLYALERLGAFFDTERIQGHPWYEPGAKVILGKQKENGSWGLLHQTAYSLLFLARASRVSTSGEMRKRPEDAWSVTTGPVRLRANGRMEIVAWIESLEIDGPIHVDSVEWSVDGIVVKTIDSDETKAWAGERFSLQWQSELAGSRTLCAEVLLVSPGGVRSEYTSQNLVVDCRWTAAEWMQAAAKTHGTSLLAEATIQASSEADGQEAARAIDDLEGTAWIAGGDDEQPRLEIRPTKSIKVEAVTLSHAASSIARTGQYVGVERVRITINGDATEHDIAAQSPGTIVIPLPKRTKVKSLVIEIVAPTEGRRGFAEVGLR